MDKNPLVAVLLSSRFAGFTMVLVYALFSQEVWLGIQTELCPKVMTSINRININEFVIFFMRISVKTVW